MSLAPRVHLSASRGTARRGVADLAHRITRNRKRVKRDAPRGWASRTRLAVGVLSARPGVAVAPSPGCLLLAPLHVNAQEVVRQLRVRKDCLRLAQKLFRPRMVAGKIARAEVRQDETAGARLFRHP